MVKQYQQKINKRLITAILMHMMCLQKSIRKDLLKQASLYNTFMFGK